MGTWRLRLLGELSASRGPTLLDHFPSRAVALLLARLAMPPLRQHGREELIELLWPEVELEVGRNRLRQALSTLRRLIEPADLAPGSVLRADRQAIALNPAAVSSDLAAFEQHLRRGEITAALAVYGGEFLPGYGDEWVTDERLRLTALQERAQAKAEQPRPPASSNEPAPASPQRHLPAYLGSFWGREREMDALLTLLRRHRLVTLCGLGGFGKTRLAVESARAVSGFDLVSLVPLAECHRAEELPDAIRNALGMAPEREDVAAQLIALLAEQRVLLVLDNFEQLVDTASGVVAGLLEHLPNLTCLVTSRRALDLPGEQVLALDTLPLPEPEMDLATAAASPALALFIDRARGARADFGLTADNRLALIELTRKLEGLPLAIEIAASRIRSYSPQEMLAALAARFSLLQRPGPRGARFGRHASLQATVEWSWQLLASPQQQSFAALSVLCGSWTADQAAAVLDCDALAPQLHEFVADSLLRAEIGSGGETRFSMLETLREFAAEKLHRKESEALQRRHGEAFLALAEGGEAGAPRLTAEDWPNCRAALANALRADQQARALRLALALRAHWSARGATPEDLECIGAAVMSDTVPRVQKSAGHELLAEISLTLGNLVAAQQHAEQALALSGADQRARGKALLALARVLWEREPQSVRLAAALEEAMQLALAAHDLELQADALRVQGTVVLKHGSELADYAAADRLLSAAEALYQQLGQVDWARRTQLSRVGCLTGLGHYDQAEALLAACEQHFSAQSAGSDLVALANMRGYLESGRGCWREALHAGRVCVRLAHAQHAHLQLTLALWNLPDALLHAGQIEVAVRLLGFAASFWERSIGPLSPLDRETVARIRARARSDLGARAADRMFAEGAGMTLAAALALATQEP